MPRAEDADERAKPHFAVIALGKLGGKELNYSSDIDLMFLYSEAGSTDGAERITNKEFFKRAANQLTALLSTYTAEGMCYRVDLRLRPDGSLGEVCISLDGARKYYAERARDWELQMLIKARVAAGHPPTGRALLNFVEPRTYSTTLDFSAVEQLSLTRERLNEKLAARQAKWGLATRIRSARLHRREARARRHPGYRIPGAVSPAPLWRRRAVGASWRHDAGAWRGCKTRIFFPEPNTGGWPRPTSFCGTWNTGCNSRTICRRTRCPPNPDALELLARRMPGGGSAAWLMRELRGHFTRVTEIYERVVRTQTPPAETPLPYDGSHPNVARPSNVVLALDQRAPALAAALGRAHLQNGYRAFEHFLERLSGDPLRLDLLNSDSDLAEYTLDLFEHSPYFAEELIRTPELVDEIPRSPRPFGAGGSPAA